MGFCFLILVFVVEQELELENIELVEAKRDTLDAWLHITTQGAFDQKSELATEVGKVWE